MGILMPMVQALRLVRVIIHTVVVVPLIGDIGMNVRVTIVQVLLAQVIIHTVGVVLAAVPQVQDISIKITVIQRKIIETEKQESFHLKDHMNPGEGLAVTVEGLARQYQV